MVKRVPKSCCYHTKVVKRRRYKKTCKGRKKGVRRCYRKRAR